MSQNGTVVVVHTTDGKWRVSHQDSDAVYYNVDIPIDRGNKEEALRQLAAMFSVREFTVHDTEDGAYDKVEELYDAADKRECPIEYNCTYYEFQLPWPLV